MYETGPWIDLAASGSAIIHVSAFFKNSRKIKNTQFQEGRMVHPREVIGPGDLCSPFN